MARALRIFVVLSATAAVVACAQLEGLGSYEKVECLDDCADGATGPDVSTVGDSAPPDLDAGADTAPTCPVCTGATPYCDPVSLRCVDCLPTDHPCSPGQLCDPDPALGFHCVQRCNVVKDCVDAFFADAGSDAGVPAGLECCSSRCIDTTVASTDCGGCGKVCSSAHIATPTCAGSACVGACNAGFGDCNANKQTDGCEVDTTTTAAHCGGCGQACSATNIGTPTCAGGSCNGTCNANFGDCNTNKKTDGCETNITTNADHCNSCTNVCSSYHMSSRTCGGGSCNGSCTGPWQDCNANKLADGCESISGVDTNNCAACGSACPAGTRNCVGGTCTAGYGQSFPPTTFFNACSQAGMTRVLATDFPDTDDSTTDNHPIGFTFSYYGTAYTTFWASTNGILGFAAPDANCCNLGCLPGGPAPNPAILAYATDLQIGLGATGGLCYATIGAAPNRRFIATWAHATYCCNLAAPIGDLTFSVVLDETTNKITIQYNGITANPNDPVVVGIQSGASGTEYSCGGTTERPIAAGDSITFAP